MMNPISSQLRLHVFSCKTTAFKKGIKRTHFDALFGKYATVGLTSETKIPNAILLAFDVYVVIVLV